jgi:hypothetical protein
MRKKKFPTRILDPRVLRYGAIFNNLDRRTWFLTRIAPILHVSNLYVQSIPSSSGRLNSSSQPSKWTAIIIYSATFLYQTTIIIIIRFKRKKTRQPKHLGNVLFISHLLRTRIPFRKTSTAATLLHSFNFPISHRRALQNQLPIVS